MKNDFDPYILTKYTTAAPIKGKSKQATQRYIKPPAVKYLEKLALDRKKILYPNVPYLSEPEFKDNSANGLTNCVTSFIRLNGFQAERISTTGRAIDRQQTFTDVTGRTRSIGRIEWIPGTGTNGSADISATIAGRSVKIEIKIGRDRMSDAQRRYQAAIEEAGGVYYVATDFTSFLDWYEQTFSK